VLVEPAAAADLAALEATWPRRGLDARLGRSLRGESTLLLARDDVDTAVVGRLEVQWTGPQMSEVAAVVGAVPELNGLDVVPSHRGRGIGTALIEAAETQARARGLQQLGIGVGCDNPAAERLYRRLGYDGGLPYTDRYTWRDEHGVSHDAADACLFLTKRLAASHPEVV
jgi:GNAT superfamily N-acetyltransferase